MCFALGMGVFGAALTSLAAEGTAHADDRFSAPPPGREPIAVVAVDPDYNPPPPPPLAVPYRAPVRIELGPSFITSGKGLGYGLTGGVGVGTGTVGGRFTASFFRGEGGDNNNKDAPTGASTSQYLAELVLDLKKRGPLHPVVAMGAGLVHVDKGGTSGEAGVGTARVGAEYQFSVDDADVRAGASLMGALAGPASDEVKDLKAYGIFDVHVAVGF